MVEYEGTKEIVNQAAVQMATVVMMAFKDTDTVPQPTLKTSHREQQRQRHGGPVLEKPSFDMDTQTKVCQTKELWSGSHEHSRNQSV